MSVNTRVAADVAEILAGILEGAGFRVEWYVPDKARPPCAVLGLPLIRYDDPDAGFCFASYEYPLALVVPRPNDATAQRKLAGMVSDAAHALDQYSPPDAGGLFSVDPLDARPATVSVAGLELPGYELTVRVRA